MYEVVENSNKVVFCRTNKNLNCMVSFRWKHQQFIQACVSINLRLDFSATTTCINCAPRHWSTKFMQNFCKNFLKKQSWNIEFNTNACLSVLTIHVISSSSSSLSSPMNFIEVKRKFRFYNSQEHLAVFTATCTLSRFERSLRNRACSDVWPRWSGGWTHRWPRSQRTVGSRLGPIQGVPAGSVDSDSGHVLRKLFKCLWCLSLDDHGDTRSEGLVPVPREDQEISFLRTHIICYQIDFRPFVFAE